MFNNELMADVHFVVGQPGRTQRLPGHRVRISSSSEITAAGEEINKQAIRHGVVYIRGAEKQSPSMAAIMELKILCASLSHPHRVSPRDGPQLFM